MKILIPLLIGIVLTGCKESHFQREAFTSDSLHYLNRKLTEISMEDIFSPPVATRVFAYPNLGAFEIYLHGQGKSILNENSKIVSPTYSDTSNIDYSYAAVEAFCILSKKLVFSEYLADSMRLEMEREAQQAGIPKRRQEMSKKYAEKICKEISAWIDADGYAQIKSNDAYSIRGEDSTWVLTPPNYESALEPNWKNLRPLFIGDPKQFQPKPRPPFSIKKDSDFYKEVMRVYNQSKQSGQRENGIAKHWDCNPNEFSQQGHSMTFTHRISPPGHWVGITKVICQQKKTDFPTTLAAYAMTTSAIFDGIISCWYTKYTEELIRPVTYINRYIDKTWEPYIQTPPFPEFTSGHSVVSGCASTVLEEMFPKTEFVDDTEVEFGLPARTFPSIREAGEEASISRFYGGIHFKFGIDNGLEQGRRIGDFVYHKITELSTKK